MHNSSHMSKSEGDIKVNPQMKEEKTLTASGSTSSRNAGPDSKKEAVSDSENRWQNNETGTPAAQGTAPDFGTSIDRGTQPDTEMPLNRTTPRTGMPMNGTMPRTGTGMPMDGTTPRSGTGMPMNGAMPRSGMPMDGTTPRSGTGMPMNGTMPRSGMPSNGTMPRTGMPMDGTMPRTGTGMPMNGTMPRTGMPMDGTTPRSGNGMPMNGTTPRSGMPLNGAMPRTGTGMPMNGTMPRTGMPMDSTMPGTGMPMNGTTPRSRTGMPQSNNNPVNRNMTQGGLPYCPVNNIPMPQVSPYNTPMGIPLYPLYGYDSCEDLDRDMEYLKQLYPNTAKRIQREIDNECDKLEYDGSVMFDEYPDKVTLDRIIDRVYDRVKDLDEAPQVEINSFYSGQRRRQNLLRDLVTIVLLNELFNRRRRYRSRRRWF